MKGQGAWRSKRIQEAYFSSGVPERRFRENRREPEDHINRSKSTSKAVKRCVWGSPGPS